MTRLWLSYAARQLLRTLGQHRALLPLLVIGILTIPTSIVAVHEMAPHAHKIHDRLGQAAGAKLVYGFFLGMIVLLFPLQVQLLHELDSSQEIENLERYPLPRRSLYHFKLIDQLVLYLPLLLLALAVTLAGGLYRHGGLSLSGQLVLCGGLVLVTLQVHLLTGFLTTAALGCLPARWLASRGGVLLLLVCGGAGLLAAVALAFPSYAERRLLVLPWILVPLAVELARHGLQRELLVPLGFLAAYVVAGYALAGWSYRANLLDGREALVCRLDRLMGQQRAAARRFTGRFLEGLLGLWSEPVPLLVRKDLRLIARPPVNRLIFVMFGLPFGLLALCVAAFILAGVPSPFAAGARLGLFGRATLMLALYGLLTLLWIPCAQIFLFSSERWPLTMTWFGPFDGVQVWKSKAVAAGFVVLPAVGSAYLGMALALSVGGGGPGAARLFFVGLLFVGFSAWIFGSLVASLGVLFPYYMQTRYRQLAGGLGFLMQLSLVPVWIQTWLVGLVAVQFFGAAGLAALLGALVLWFGFAQILAREACEQIGIREG